MMKPTKRKKNPGLFIPEPNYQIPYISPYSDFLKQNNFFRTEEKTTDLWRTYPIYLKETLFFFEKEFKKIRGAEVGFKFFSADDLKEKANKEYNKGNYQ